MKVALVGNPNAGKSSLFNRLTGLNQKTSNLHGTTVEVKRGTWKINATTSAEILDLPGSYSLFARSEEEAITAKSVFTDRDTIDAIIYVADASNLKRSLIFYSQLCDLGLPIIIALNMLDLAERKGIHIDIEKLSAELSVLIVPTNAKTGKGVEQLAVKIGSLNADIQRRFFAVSNDAYREYVAKNTELNHSGTSLYSLSDHQEIYAEDLINRNRLLSEIDKNVSKKSLLKGSTIGYWLDKLFLHPIFGYIAFVAIMYVLFWAVFSVAAYPQGWIETGFAWMSTYLGEHLPSSFLTTALTNGILPGLGGILVFVPQIAIVFALISFLEDSGYMPRAGFLMDRLMTKVGLNGRSVVPMVGGMACAIPAIMSARTIANQRERLITILITPLMSCSARIPVYTLLISLIVPESQTWHGLDERSLLLTIMYFLGAFVAVLIAGILNIFLKKGAASFMMMELPVYQWPSVKNVAIIALQKSKVFVWQAGKVIMVVSLILWFLGSTAPGDRFAQIEKKYKSMEVTVDSAEISHLMAAEKLEQSYIGIMGRFIEPAIRPLGFDWKTGIAIISSFVAREVFTSTMGTLFSVGESSDYSKLSSKMMSYKKSDGITAQYGTAYGISLMLFYAFAMQCVSTLAIVKRETGTWLWPAFQFVYMGLLAYFSAYLAFQILS